MCAGVGVGVGILATPEVNHFPYICFLFEFPPGPLWVYGFGICIPFPAGNWVSLVLLVAFLLVFILSTIILLGLSVFSSIEGESNKYV